jgi:selenocysteine lyase/cysteine desulfurase
LLDHSAHATRLAASLIAAAATDVAVTCNATAALSAVIACECRRISRTRSNAVIMYTNLSYGSVKLMVEDAGAPSVICCIPFPPPSSSAIVSAIAQCVQAQADSNAPVATIVIDQVTSNSALLMPVAAIAQFAALHSITVVVDAAHALGAIDVNVPALGVHYWVSNCHKWLCAPKGSAVLWVAPSHQQFLRPVVVSHAHLHGLSSAFVWDGCRDYGSLLALPAVIAQWKILNRSGACDTYRRTLLDAAVSLCAREWCSAWWTPSEMRGPMALVELPQNISARFQAEGVQIDANAAAAVQNALHRGFNVEAPIKCLQGRLFIRLSAHIYNTLQHYRSVADAVSCFASQESWHVLAAQNEQLIKPSSLAASLLLSSNSVIPSPPGVCTEAAGRSTSSRTEAEPKRQKLNDEQQAKS